jgi:hypothetical protein
MEDYTAQLATLIDLDARHDDLLDRLDDLDKRVERVLSECLADRAPAAAASTAPPVAAP